MPGLVDHHGRPISSQDFKKAEAPRTGPAYGQWGGEGLKIGQLPGGGIVQFDLSKLTLDDYRTMRDHYQVNASLAVLSFMQHQSDWTIECDDKKIAAACEEDIKEIWTPLNRSMGTANWAGFSPNALEWENDDRRGRTVISKVKDLIPEYARVNWKEVDGYAPPNHAPPKFKIYDGIKYLPGRGSSPPIPVENSYWFPLLMENGDYYGRKLLRPAFQSWFFSILIHLFANRYYERFGEPTPVGRAPFDEEIDIGGAAVRGNDYLLGVLAQLRSRSAVVLPSDSTDMGQGKREFDYDIQYLESQMRGADFERYLTRLDEEISIGLFTPILLLRTADVGSYNLGVGHMQMYLWMLNAMNEDRAIYINKYLLSPMVNYNFSEKAPRARIAFRKLGNTNTDLLKEVLVALIKDGTAKPDLVELGKMTGMTLKEIKKTLQPPPAPGAPAAGDTTPPASGDTTPAANTKNRGLLNAAHMTTRLISERVRPQVEKAIGVGGTLSLGYTKKMAEAFETAGVPDARVRVDEMYGRINLWAEDALPVYKDTSEFMGRFGYVLDAELERITSGSS